MADEVEKRNITDVLKPDDQVALQVTGSLFIQADRYPIRRPAAQIADEQVGHPLQAVSRGLDIL
jgi:hypothetical protein